MHLNHFDDTLGLRLLFINQFVSFSLHWIQDNRKILRSTGSGTNLKRPQCELVQGFDVTFKRTDGGMGIIANIANKTMVRPSLHEIFKDAHQRGQDLESFFNQHLRNRTAIVSYSKRFITMDSIVREDERTKFERDGEKISYGRYVEERYGVKVLFKERRVIKVKNGAAFLPQFLNIAASNEMVGNEGNKGASNVYSTSFGHLHSFLTICAHLIPNQKFEISKSR